MASDKVDANQRPKMQTQSESKALRIKAMQSHPKPNNAKQSTTYQRQANNAQQCFVKQCSP